MFNKKQINGIIYVNNMLILFQDMLFIICSKVNYDKMGKKIVWEWSQRRSKEGGHEDDEIVSM